MATRSLDDFEGYIHDQVEQDHLTHREISERLEAKFPGVHGFSIRTVEDSVKRRGYTKLHGSPRS